MEREVGWKRGKEEGDGRDGERTGSVAGVFIDRKSLVGGLDGMGVGYVGMYEGLASGDYKRRK